MARTLFNPNQPIIVLKAELYGKKDPNSGNYISRLIRMLLNTSSTYSVIPWEIASALQCGPTETSKKLRIITSRGPRIVPVVTLNKMIVLDKVIKDIEVICHDIPQKACVDGILGLNFIRHFKLFINFEKGILELD